MSQGMKVSKVGFNVLTTGNANLSFSSDLATHALYTTVTITKPTGGSNGTYTHNLGYIPKTWIFYQQATGGTTYYSRIPFFDIDTYDIDYSVGTDTIIVRTAGAGTNILNFRTVIFTRSPNP